MVKEVLQQLAIELTKAKISQSETLDATSANDWFTTYEKSLEEINEATRKGRKYGKPVVGGGTVMGGW